MAITQENVITGAVLKPEPLNGTLTVLTFHTRQHRGLVKELRLSSKGIEIDPKSSCLTVHKFEQGRTEVILYAPDANPKARCKKTGGSSS